MTSLSKRGNGFTTNDYEVRLILVNDELLSGMTRYRYAVYNRVTGVREATWDTLPYAVASAVGLQKTLDQVFEIVDGNKESSEIQELFNNLHGSSGTPN